MLEGLSGCLPILREIGLTFLLAGILLFVRGLNSVEGLSCSEEVSHHG